MLAKKIRLAFPVFCLLVIGTSLLFTTVASALSGSQFDPGYIIDDSKFYAGSSMSTNQVQNFLNAKVPTCDTNGTTNKSYYYNSSTGRVNNSADAWVTTSRATYGTRYDKWYKTTIAAAPYTCLKNYKQDTPAKTAESGLCGNLPAYSGRGAAAIITDVSAACGVSPKVLIVLLQKEQGLVTDVWPWDNEYQKATGFACPDTSGCNSAYYGFFNQVYSAARQFKRYRADPTNWNYVAGQSNKIYYNPSTSCGYSWITIRNQATAGLYDYTPYQPNKAALNNLYGSGDKCSAYGNRNFWRYYHDWFGEPTVPFISSTVYDPTTDQMGERARIGISLGRKPTANVTIPIYVFSPSTDRIVGSVTSLTIKPSDYNNPANNIVLIAGKDNTALNGTFQNELRFGKASSKDPYYNGAPLSDYSASFIHVDNNSAPAVFRLYKSGVHFYTTNTSERDSYTADGWASDGTGFSYCYGGSQAVARLTQDGLYRLAVEGSVDYNQAIADGFTLDKLVFSTQPLGNVPVYWHLDTSSGNSLYTTSQTEGLSSGYTDEGVAFYACSGNNEAIYRLYRPGAQDYFLTSSPYERDRAINSLGYTYEGTSFYNCSSGGTEPIYRLYNPTRRKHLYTASADERNKALHNHGGWTDDGIVFTVCAGGTHPVYRLFKPDLGKYLYTASTGERDKAASNGYTVEGAIFSGL
jgi:hypothetical protein